MSLPDAIPDVGLVVQPASTTLRILVVDDDATTTLALQELLLLATLDRPAVEAP